MDWIYRNKTNMEFSSYVCKVKTIFKEEGETILEGWGGGGILYERDIQKLESFDINH